MAASISMRVQYTGEPGEHTAVLSLENGHIRLDDFLYATKLSFARTGEGELVCANQARNVEGRFLGEGLLVVGPKIKPRLTMHELLALPTNNGQPHSEDRTMNTTTTVVTDFPKSLRPISIKATVREFMRRQNGTGSLFEPPPLNRGRHQPSGSEEQIHCDAHNCAFSIVNLVLQRKYPNDRTRYEWVITSNRTVEGRESLGGVVEGGGRPDEELKIPSTNQRAGGAEGKCYWTLFEGRRTPHTEVANLDRLDRPLFIPPGTPPRVDIFQKFNEGDDNESVRKSVGQIHGYAKAGRWKVAILYCDGYLWLLVMDPKNPDDPFLSEVIMSTDAATATEVTQTEVIYYASEILVGTEPAPTLPNVPVPQEIRGFSRTNVQTRAQRNASQKPPEASGLQTRAAARHVEKKAGGASGSAGGRTTAAFGKDLAVNSPSRERACGGESRDEPLLKPAEGVPGLERGLDRGAIQLTASLGSGYAGVVFKGRLAGAPVIVKTLDMAHSTRRLPALLNEVYTLKDLPSLWGKRVPRLLAYGPYTQSLYAVVVGEIPGRVLRSTDADHADDAAEALRSVHQRGYLHGDIKLENFLIGNNGTVFVIDFGLATKSANREAHAREQGTLRKCFIY